MQKIISVQDFPVHFSNTLPLVLIAGPCVMESREHALKMVEALVVLTSQKKISFVYKSSFDKANRTSVNAERGIGLDNALKIFEEIKKTFNIPVITDVHSAEQCAAVASVVDILQIPAFLCRQTDLLEAAAKTGRVINIKKGQFLAPWDMENVVKKMESFGNANVLLCERGVSFGYNTLVSDMRSLPIMAKTGYPVIFDATHSVQQPGGLGGKSGGQREFAPILARAAVAVGVAGVFAETHENPDQAPSDGPNMIPLKEMGRFIDTLQAFDHVAKQGF
ncbi:MAG: 3-deoxy-8-phosphooctulonate synthase [Proteobacteria bacterium]|nr:3-deoxy-8-phosphooctulonate synthase [Pseudomonadota bacterium]